MFETIQNGLSEAMRSLRGKAKLSEANMREGLELVRTALLEADVNYDVAQEFINRVSEDAVGEKVLQALRPTEQLVGIVHRELVNLMGPVDHSLNMHEGTNILMLCGLQGSGKTTTCGKLGRLIQQRGRRVMLVAADLQRPAAIDQLHVIGEQLGLAVYSERGAPDPVVVCHNAVRKAKEEGIAVVILDTAGRLHIDDELMEQLKRIDKRVEPDQVLLVVDGMTGQDAVNSAKAFNEALELDGLVMTKLDGDARGGAALSVKQVTGVPIKFIGTGEHLDNLEEFHPDRMASRILGMGDMLSLVETAQREFDQEEMAKAEARMRQGEFTLDDFRAQMSQLARPGLMKKMMGMMPGMGGLNELMEQFDEAEIHRLNGMIDSMTAEERRNPGVIDQSRRRRIAAGSGVEPHEVNDLVKQFDGMASLMKEMSGLGMRDRMRKMQQLQSGGFLNPGSQLSAKKIGTGKRLTADEKRKMKKQREKELRKKKRESRN
ncbi:MAG TPA: signal recognition particle protein [Pirellulales bacterium]|nr:signal recognition particle protein [Pirellulales bacterium]